MKKFALIVGGGTGSRMGSDVPKQFLELAGKPVLFHTIEKFHGIADEIVVVLPQSQFDRWQELKTQYRFSISHTLVAGGATRTQSVKNGLSALSGEGIVAIHDAVRPLLSQELISRLFDATLASGSAVPVVEVRETLRTKSGQTVNRSDFFVVQTPQCFPLESILKAYNSIDNEMFTDDAGVFETLGGKIHTVPGETTNIKITFQEDMAVAEAILKRIS